MVLTRFHIVSDPTGFATHPKHHLIKVGEAITLSCSFYDNPGQDFYWKMDGEILTDGGKLALKTDGRSMNISVLKQENRIILQLSFVASEPDMEGLYSCVVKDKMGHFIESRQGRVRLKGKPTLFPVINPLLHFIPPPFNPLL